MLQGLKLDAGDRFELPMHLAYETGVVTTLPAIKHCNIHYICCQLVEPEGIEPSANHPSIKGNGFTVR